MSKANVLRGEGNIADNRKFRRMLRASASVVALGGMLASGVAVAQEDVDDDDDLIVVTGIRQSLASAQNIKRTSDTVVDAITAEDIGALPDRSVTEALQRVPGIAINRFAGSNDPDHFSVEGSGVVIRGLNFVRSEFNGRTAFAAGVGGQALNFADVPSELLGSVIISKNSTADMIEGGLAGTVNLVTRKPLDRHGFQAAFSAEANYGDFAKEWSPTFSGLLSNTWDTDSGTWGLLVSGSYSQVKSRADGLQIANYQNRDGVSVAAANTSDRQICRTPLPSDEDNFTLPGGNALCDDFGAPGSDGYADYADARVAPVGGQFRTQDYNRQRDGIAVSAQYETLDGGTRVTAEFIRSHSTNAWGEHTYETAPDLSEYSTFPIGCEQNASGPNVVDSNGVINPDDETPPRAQCPIMPSGTYQVPFQNYNYDANGVFQSGYIVDASNGWRGPVHDGRSPFVPIGGSQFSLARRQIRDEITNNDFSFNVESQLTDRLHVDVDLHYANSRKENLDVSVFGSIFADQELDISGKAPVVIPHAPQFMSYTWSGPSPELDALIVRDGSGNDTGVRDDATYFTDPRFQFWRAAMDHAEDSRGSQSALKTDFEYDFSEDSFIRSAKVGFRYQNRDQTVRYSTYNWGMLSEVWSGDRPINFGDTADSGLQERYDFPNFWRGNVPPPPGAFYYSGDLINDYDGSVNFFQSIQSLYSSQFGGDGGNWMPLDERDGAIAGTRYLPSDVQRVAQDDYAFYGMLNFSNDGLTDGVRIAGNVGLRYVRSDVLSESSRGPGTPGGVGIAAPFDDRCQERDIPPAAGGGTARPGGICLLGQQVYEDLQNFLDGSFTPSIIKNDYDYLLPSFNLRVGATDDLILRFAASKVLTRPDNGLIRNYFVASLDTSGNFTGSAGNPLLVPATAWQFDLTAEWYFDTVGSLTGNLFYKEVKNFFYQNVGEDVIANGSGETRDVTVRGPDNYDGTGKIKGFEVAYQQTYDFLPGILSGLGLSANYTYIESSGLPNSFLNGGNVPNNSAVVPGNLPLEQLSKHNVNATVFYEQGPLSMRAAYNWRSKFLLTAADVIFPYYSIYNDETGQLDASIFYNINDNLRIGVQGVNLLNEVTKTLQSYSGDPADLAPRSYFMNDRRFSFIIRGQF